MYLFVQCEIIATIKLINISITSHSSFPFLFVVFVTRRKINSLTKFRVYSIVLLTLVTLLAIGSPEVRHLA